jgi:hypothetical protein
MIILENRGFFKKFTESNLIVVNLINRAVFKSIMKKSFVLEIEPRENLEIFMDRCRHWD